MLPNSLFRDIMLFTVGASVVIGAVGTYVFMKFVLGR